MNPNNKGNILPFYRSRGGVVLGICQGFSDYASFPVFWIRVALIALALTTAFWPVAIAYIVVGILVKPEPVVPLETEEDQEFYDSYVSSRTMALKRLKQKFDLLDQRIQRMEDAVTKKDFEWEKKFGEME